MRSIRCAGCAVAFAAVCGLAMSAGAQQSSGNPGRSAAAPNAKSANSLPNQFHRLAGEWEGQVQVAGSNGMTGSSLVNLSARLEDSNSTLACSFAGQAFGKPMQGSSVWTAANGGSSGQVQHAMYSSVSGKTMALNASASSAGNELTLAGSNATGPMEQTLTMLDDNHCVIEWFTKDAQGHSNRVMSMDLTRMPNGQRAQAAAGLNDPTLMDKARNAARSETASAEPNK